MNITKADYKDVDRVAQLYDSLNDYLAKNTNHPCWKKGVYPTRNEALHFYETGTLYIAEIDSKLAGSMALTHEPEKEPENGSWLIEANYHKIFVIHVFAVHPDFLRQGVASSMLQFAEELARKQGIKSIRLDVYENNIAAINTYEKNGFHFIDKVDIGLSEYGLELFSLYEKVIN